MYYLTSSSSKEISENLPSLFQAFSSPFTPVPKLLKLGRLWAGDNGAFSGKFTKEIYLAYIDKMQKYIDTNLFMTVPDVLEDAKTTIELFHIYKDIVKNYGYSRAFVAQDGLEFNDCNLYCRKFIVSWDEFEWLFIGGSTYYKLSCGDLILQAKEKGKNVHVGRVNSPRRFKWAKNLGAFSVDGTHINFQPREAINRIILWNEEI